MSAAYIPSGGIGKARSFLNAAFSQRSRRMSPTGIVIWDPERETIWESAEFDRSLLELSSLAPDWNGYGERAVDPFSLHAARALVHELGPTAPPHVSPLHDGGVQLEWHVNGWDIEIEISPDASSISAFTSFEDRTLADRQLSGNYLRALRDLLRSIEA